MVDPTGELPVDTLVDAWFTLADATTLLYYDAQAIYNQYMANQNIGNTETYQFYQSRANEYEQKAGQKLWDLWTDAIAAATPYVNAASLKIAKNVSNATIQTSNVAWGVWDKSKAYSRITDTWFFKNNKNLSKTNVLNQWQAVYKDNKTWKYYSLDNLHKNHLEVFDKKGNHLWRADPKTWNIIN